MTGKRYLLQWGMTWNNLQQARNSLKQPTTSMKWPETTYNKQETTWNDLQWARNDLKWSTTSKTQPTVTSTYLQQAKKKMQIDQQQADFQIILQYRANGSLLSFPPNIWLQSFKHCFMENHDENRVSSISILSFVFFYGI